MTQQCFFDLREETLLLVNHKPGFYQKENNVK